MPRIYLTGKAINDYCDRTGEGSSTFDVCRCCYPDIMKNPTEYFDTFKPYNGEPAPDSIGGDCEHPSYDEDEYTCQICGDELTGRDDYAN